MKTDPDLLILDFDGTFTNVDEEAVPFLATYKTGLAEIVGQAIDDVWERSVGIVQSNPDAHGFEFAGKIVAPSHADPYILATSVAHLVLGELKLDDARGELEGLFRTAYATSTTVFRPDAGDVLETLLARGKPVRVVSNSHTDSVIAKLQTLMPEALERIEVTGNARKFHLVDPEPSDPRFDAVPEQLDIDGLSRPLYVRRGRYFERLREIWEQTQVPPERTLVCGDIYELDLALPAALGARVHLVGRERTPDWERNAVTAAGGSFSTELSGVLATLA